MSDGPTSLGTVERAFQLARSGECTGIDDIRVRLTREGYGSVIQHLTGPTIRRDLLKLCKAAQADRPPEAGEATASPVDQAK